MAATKLSYILKKSDATYFRKQAYENNAHVEWNLPQGYPKTLVSPLAWKAEEVIKRQLHWYLQLDEEDIEP